MSDGTILKADKDFTKEVDAALPEAEQLAKVPFTMSLSSNCITDFV